MSQSVSKTYLDNLLREYEISTDEQEWGRLVDQVYNKVYDKTYGDDPEKKAEKEADKENAKKFINGILDIFTGEHYNKMRQHGMSDDDIELMYYNNVALLENLKEKLERGSILPSFERKTYSPLKLSNKSKSDRLKHEWEGSPNGRPLPCASDKGCSIMGGKKTRTKKSKRINKKFRYYSKKNSRRKNSRRNYRKK